MDNAKKYMKQPDNEKSPHVPESLLEYLAQFTMKQVEAEYKKELNEFISCGEYFTSSFTTEPIEYYCQYLSLVQNGIIPDYIKLSKNIDFYYDTDIISALWTKYFGTGIKKAKHNNSYNKKYDVTISPKAQRIPKSLEFSLEHLYCYTNSKDIRERCFFALYPPKEYKSTIERYYILYNRKFINAKELGLLCDDLYQQYLKSSK